MSCEDRIYNEINRLYPKINEIKKNNIFSYSEVSEEQQTPIPVTAIVDDEYNLSSGVLQTYQNWTIPNDVDTCFYNAQKTYSKKKYDDNKYISKNVNKLSGLLFRKVELTNIKSYNENIFENVPFDENNIINTFSIVDGFRNYEKSYEGFTLIESFQSSDQVFNNLNDDKENCIEIFGYFFPRETGEHTFKLCDANIDYLWISNDNGLYDYTVNNADIHKNTVNMGNGKECKVYLMKNNYYPIRFHIRKNSSTSFLLQIIDPMGSNISSNTDNHNYFVTLTENGSIYYKKLLYFALTKIDKNSEFQCHFIEDKKTNYDTIKKIKSNPPFVYKYVEIPTEITYESGIFNVQGVHGEEVTVGLEVPEGGYIEVIDAKWGLDSDQTIDVPKVFVEDHTDPNIIMRTNEYNYPYTTVRKNEPAKWDGSARNGFYYKEYINQGYWGGNIGWFATRTPSNNPTSPNQLNRSTQVKHVINQGLRHNSSYVFEGIITASNYGGNRLGDWNSAGFLLESDDKARLIIKSVGGDRHNSDGQVMIDMESNAGRPAGWIDVAFIQNSRYSFTLYCGNGGGNGFVRVKFRKYHKQKRGGYHTSNGYDIMNGSNGGATNAFRQFCTVSHLWEDFGRVKEVQIPDTVKNKTQHVMRKEYIEPTPQENVTRYIPTLFKAVEDVTNKIKSKVVGQMRTLVLDGDYNSLAEPFAIQVEDKIKNENLQKTLRIQYKYYLPDPQGTSNKKLFVSDEGALVLAYDYNNTTNYEIISKLPSDVFCPSGNECNGYFKIENDGMLSLMKDGSKLWNTTTSFYKNFDDENNPLANFAFPDNIVENGYWRDTLTADFFEKGVELTSKNSLISENNKFKLTFRENKLTIVYCINSYISEEINNKLVNYTILNENIVTTTDGTSKQIYFLYRINASDLVGKKILKYEDKLNNMKTIQELPNNFTEVLKFTHYEETKNALPLMNTNEYAKIANNHRVGDYLTTDDNLETCKTKCEEEAECDHFFFMNTRNGDKCVRDKNSNNLPIYTTNSSNMDNDTNNISASNMYKKQYEIKSYCASNLTTSLNKEDATAFNDFNMIYESKLENDPFKTYFCSDSKYWDISDKMTQLYNSSCKTEGFRNKEGFSENCGTIECVNDKLDELKNVNIKDIEKKQVKINDTYNRIAGQYDELGKNVDTVILDQTVNEIPDKYKKNLTSYSPNTNTRDAREDDSKTLLIYENSFYTVATISMASILIAAVILARD